MEGKGRVEEDRFRFPFCADGIGDKDTPHGLVMLYDIWSSQNMLVVDLEWVYVERQ